MPNRDQELVDHLDDSGEVIGPVSRTEMRAGNLRHRSVFVVALNEADEVIVHRRAGWKDVWPEYWDIAVGGVVMSGESWESAASRELAEELGVAGDLVYLGEDRFEDESVREHCRIYQVRVTDAVAPVDGEVAEYEWVPVGELRRWISERRVCPDSLAVVLPRLDAA